MTDKQKKYYKNEITNEVTDSKDQAKIWHSEGADIEIWYFSTFLGEWICGMEWLH